MTTPKATHVNAFIVVKVHAVNGGLFDMMRYDNCCPATEAESGRLERILERREAAWVIFDRFVPPNTISGMDPTVGRWKSYNIEVHPECFSSLGEAEYIRDTLQGSKK